ncbi:conserved hypothetical protein [Leishmania major strain Friedlin]|uniref:Protein kinase domain-containing protein n=1 Tax=Leishmania major TaxID=5664 RepID=Q4Q6J7_LEIMA|nr:conserved hypothetical protein [Leishmania major strain Friedlin]CAG9579220.1 hypothetical_protein_-_conserved [Leishmania major strain Friedlin]CAJ08253.1 conserved hypothetical protein [Leishmania major strain Friedlin]|eukprot:XP_001685051.1 conserved hypothetical protein [Leishmania major strain Friedlin]
MQSPSPSSCGSPIRPAALPHQPNTTSRTQEDLPLGKASVATLADATTSGLKTEALTATNATGSVLSAAALPLQEDNSFLSSITSGEPSPRSEWSSKTRQHVLPLSSSSYLSHYRPSADREAQESGASPSVSRSAHAIMTSRSSIERLVGSQTTDCDSSYALLRASDTAPPECFASPPTLRGIARSAEVFVNLEDTFSAAAGPTAMQPAATATLCTPPKLTGANGHRSSQAVPPFAIATVATAVTPAAVKNPAICNDASVCLKDATQHSTERGGAHARHSHVSPPSSSSLASGASELDNDDDRASEGNRLGTPTHRSFLRRSLFGKPSPALYTTSPPPSTTADVAASNGFGGEYSLSQPAAHFPNRCSSNADTALVFPSQTALVTGISAVADIPQCQQNRQQAQQRPLSLFKQTIGKPTPPRTAVSDRESLGSPTRPLQRNSTTAFDEEQAAAPAAATTEFRSGATPFRSLVGCTAAAAAAKGPTADMETRVLPIARLITTPVRLQPARVSLSTEDWPALGAKASQEDLSDAEGMPWCGLSHPAQCTTCPPQQIEATVDEVLQHLDEDSGGVAAHPCRNPYNSPHTPRGLSSVSCPSRSLSVCSSGLARSYAASFACERSVSVTEQDGMATAISVSEAQPEELDCCHTPASPHTPLGNRTPGPVGIHDNSMTQYSLGHSHSRYRSQLLSQSITPQRSARRALSRQTTPSQSFRSKVQSLSFESQQQQYMSNYLIDPINGEPASAAERDYLAPSRNPFSLYRTLEPYATNLLVLTLGAAPGSTSPDFGLSEHDLTESQAAFTAALQRTAFRPDAAVVLYEQLVPPPSNSPGVSHRARMEESAAHAPLAALLISDVDTEESLSLANLPLTASGCSGKHGRAWSVLLEQDKATKPSGAGVVANGCGRRTTPLAAQTLDVQSPTGVIRTDPQTNAALTSSSSTPAVHPCASASVALPEIEPLTPQSLFCHGMQRTTPLVAAVEAASGSIPLHSPLATGAASASSGELRDTSISTSLLKQPQRGECAMSDNASPLPQRPTQNPITMESYSESSTGCGTVAAGRQIHFEYEEGDGEAAWSGCDEVCCPFSPTSVEEGDTQKVLHARSSLDLRAGGSGSTWSSYGSPNYLCNTVANTGFSASAQPSPVKELKVFRVTSALPAWPAPECEAALATYDREARAVALPLPSLNLTRLANHSPRLQFRPPTLQRHPSLGREVAELRIASESSWVRGAQAPVVAGVNASAPSSEHADTSATAQIGCRLAESFSDPLEANDTSEEEVPGDRFQAHHVFQFLHRITTTCGGGDVRAAKREDGRRAIPLCVEVNGVTWLAMHRLNGLPYAVKEVPAAAFNLAELRCLTLSVNPPSGRETTNREARLEPRDQYSAVLTADDRLEAEDCIVRYYSVSTPLQNSINPEVHLLQLEYFPRGSLSELARRCSETHGAFSAHEPSSFAVGAGVLSSRFWLEAVTQGLRGLRVLHHADLIHGCPLPLSLFLCGNTPSAVRFKWSCFGNARADADIYPTESLPAWVSDAVSRLYRRAISGGSSVTPDVMEVAVFCLGILEVLVNCLAARVLSVRPSRASQRLSELEWIEVVVMEKSLELYATEKENGEDMQALVRLMRLLWDVSNSYRTAAQALAQLNVRVDSAARVVEQVYECELARLTRQLEERRRRPHRRQQQGQPQVLHGANAAFSLPTDAFFLRSPAMRTVAAGASSRRPGEISELSSPPLHPAHDLAVTRTSVSSLGAAAPLPKSRNGTPQLVCSARLPLHHTLLNCPITVAGSLFLPASTAAAPAGAAFAPPATLRVERTLSDMSGRRGGGGMMGHRTRSELHPSILKAVNHMLETAVKSGEGGARDAMTALLRPAVESMCQRGWTTLYAGVPLAVTGVISVDARAGTSKAAEALMKSLQPMTSFE